MKFTDDQIHQICDRLRECKGCSGCVQTSYGPATPGCYWEAKGILDAAAAIVRAADQPDAGRAYYETHEPPHCPTCHCGAACNWTQDADGDWHTGCEQTWCLMEGSPADNDMTYCHGCGRKIAQASYVEPPICDECGENLVAGACPECTADNSTDSPKTGD